MATAVEPFSSSTSSNSDSKKTPSKKRLLIVGGGMAAHGLCTRLVSLGATEKFDVTIFGNESHRSYDRVNLSKFFESVSADDLLLSNDDWYEQNEIKFKTGHFIQQVDREKRVIVDSGGNQFEFDQLVIATGSRAWVPPIPGADLPGVFVYRTLDDLKQIKRHVDDSGARTGAVLGGGLLGLESAKVLMDLGLQTQVIEMAPGLMPKQLDARAADRLKEHVQSLGVAVHLVRRTERISKEENGTLSLHFTNADSENVDILIIAAGVRPNDQLAESSGLAMGSRGGIVVDYGLQTSDPNIFAIGECVSFQDHVYGLVAPCYRMADVLAKRLAGKEDYFLGADESAELKLLGIPVVVIGRAIGNAPSCVVLSQEDESAYRKIIMEQGRFAGAACVGDWDQIPLIRHAIHQNKTLWPRQRSRFQRTGSPWIGSGEMSVSDWPASSVICSCLGVSKAELESAIASHAGDVGEVIETTRASTACGSCHSLVCELAGGQGDRAVVPGAKTMLVASVLAIVAVCAILLLPPIEFARSVQESWRNVDVLWRTDLARQVSGFTTLGLLVLGMVFSLRKRLSWFRFGSYAVWRSIHAVLGVAVLIAIGVHTGLRLGENLNFVLATVFLATALLGGAAGLLSGLESQLSGSRAMLVRRWRPRLTQLHTWLFWPLPALIAAHVITFYWFSN